LVETLSTTFDIVIQISEVKKPNPKFETLNNIKNQSPNDQNGFEL
jgi:hypothetical protein